MLKWDQNLSISNLSLHKLKTCCPVKSVWNPKVIDFPLQHLILTSVFSPLRGIFYFLLRHHIYISKKQEKLCLVWLLKNQWKLKMNSEKSDITILRRTEWYKIQPKPDCISGVPIWLQSDWAKLYATPSLY